MIDASLYIISGIIYETSLYLKHFIINEVIQTVKW